jgi:hypothetical protein
VFGHVLLAFVAACILMPLNMIAAFCEIIWNGVKELKSGEACE